MGPSDANAEGLEASVATDLSGRTPPSSTQPQRIGDPDRLDALAATGLLDSAPEEAFDRAVRLATRLLGTPVGLVSLVDKDRQFFKAQTGLPEWAATARETPLSHSFCQHVVIEGGTLAICDAREDARVRENLAIRDLGVIAYLGVPIHAPDGQVLGSFCAIQSTPRDWTSDDRDVLEDISAIIECEIVLRAELRRSAELEARARDTQERYRLALHVGRIGTYEFNPQTQTVHWDDELYAIYGLPKDEPDLFTAVQGLIHPDDKPGWEADVAASLDPAGTGRHDMEFRFRRADTGETRWLHTVGQATFDNGVPVCLVGIGRDITARKVAQDREGLLVRELNHRVKNLFAIVAGMIGMTARRSTSPKDMAKALRGRVQALASAHELIQPAIIGERLENNDLTLEALASTILDPFMGMANDVRFSGPRRQLSPEVASNLALVLHELATNAGKYGSLSVDGGALDLVWEVSADDDGDGEVLHLSWAETGGPRLHAAPETSGFGSTLVDMILGAQLNGRMTSDWKEGGVHHRLRLPLP